MLHVSGTTWALTVGLIVVLLALDWLVIGRRPHHIGAGEATRWSLGYIGVALVFGAVLAHFAGWNLGAQYFTGYVVEKSLSVDNLFVFMLIISAFRVPANQQPRALTIGIAMALVLRTAFILLGAKLISTFSFMFLIFGLALVATSVQLYSHRNDDPTVDENVVVRIARRALPMSDDYDRGRIITHVRGRLAFTPLLLALLAIGTTDLLFAFDSIPAVFGVTDHAYIVFAANAFALLGLRPLYFLVSSLLDRLVYLSVGLSAILAFIGVKLLLEFAHQKVSATPEISTVVSLAVVAGLMGATVLASYLRARRHPEDRAHPGTLRRPRPERPEDRTSLRT